MKVHRVLGTLACIIINFDLSSEQVEEIVAVVKEKTRLYMAEYHQCARLEVPIGLRERQLSNQANFQNNRRGKLGSMRDM